MVNRETKRKRTEKNTNRLAIIAITVVVVCLALFLGFRAADLRAKKQQYQEREQSLVEQVEDEKERAVQLEERRKYVKTKQYIEEIAKEKLGLTNPDEILLRPNEK